MVFISEAVMSQDASLPLFSLLTFVNTSPFPLIELPPLSMGRCGQLRLTVEMTKTDQEGTGCQSTETGIES